MIIRSRRALENLAPFLFGFETDSLLQAQTRGAVVRIEMIKLERCDNRNRRQQVQVKLHPNVMSNFNAVASAEKKRCDKLQ